MQGRLTKIFNYFGEMHQREKLIEEAKEYIESGEKEEIADLFILSYQHYLCDPEVRTLVEYKIKRTEKRIKDGYYD